MPKRTLINLHAVIPASAVNGPGRRMVVFFQGCTRGCPGCFNPETHSFRENIVTGVEELFDGNLTPGIEGVTVSGGEPFAQPAGLLELLRAARRRSLSTVVYTGRTIEGLRGGEETASCLPYIDVLVDGPYEAGRPEATLLARGSTNQRIHLLSGRYEASDLMLPGKAEVSVARDGTVRATGFSRITFPLELR